MDIKITIKGTTPLLMNRYMGGDVVPDEGTDVLPGDAGTPREQATPKRYYDDNGYLFIPGPNIFAAIIEAGKYHKIGKSKVTTLKTSLVPAGIAVVEMDCLLHDDKGHPLTEWEVDSRSVVNPATGGRRMCHRPRIDEWSCSFSLDVDPTMFGPALVRKLIDDAGKKVGLLDYRPARKGPFGRYVVVKWAAEKAVKAAEKKKAA